MLRPLFDAHCHLQDPRCGEAGPLLARARTAGVEHLVCCGTQEGDWRAVLAISQRYPEVIPMLGLHPWRLAEAGPDWFSALEGLLETHRAGLGECGLDFAMRNLDREAQEGALRLQVRLAVRLDRPLALHCVRAWGALLDLLREEGVPSAGALVHAYGGSAETARELQALGVSLSFSPALLGRPKTAEALAAVGPHHLLLESDAPDGTAQPADLPVLVEAAARIRGTTVTELAHRTCANGLKLFREVSA